MASQEKVDLSVIVPAFNEAPIILRTVESIRQILSKSKYSYEIIIAEDGSTDGTDKIAENLSRKFGFVRWLHSSGRLGRGKAVANAIKHSRGRIVGFIDADLATPAEYIPSLAKEIEEGADICVGVRLYRLSLWKIPRWITSRGYAFLERLLLHVSLRDTEAGNKFFNRVRILDVLDEIEDNHWFWDTEIMVRSCYKGLRIKEIPTEYVLVDHNSKVNLINDSVDYFVKLLRFRSKLGMK